MEEDAQPSRISTSSAPWLLGACLMALAPQVASGHGSGLPEPIDVRIDETSSVPLLVWSTYGVMVPKGPLDWRWICEEVAGGEAIVTGFATIGDERMLMGTGLGLFVSEDRCEWRQHQDIPPDLDILSIEGGPEALYVAAFEASEAGGGSLYRSVDGGISFAPFQEDVFRPEVGILGLALDGSGEPALATVLERGAGRDGSDSLAMYWSGGGGEGAVIGEEGSPWRRYPVTELGGDQLIALGVAEVGGEAQGFGAIRSGEGDVFARLHPNGEITPLVDMRPFREFVSDFSVGTTPGTLWMAAPVAGLYQSKDWGETWAPHGPQSDAYCIVPRGQQVYQCASEWFDGGAVLRRGGRIGEGLVFSFGWVRGPLECPEGSTVARICGPLWDNVKTFGFDAPTPTPTPPEEIEGEGGCQGESDGTSSPQDASLLGLPLALAYLGRRHRRKAPIKKRAN